MLGTSGPNGGLNFYTNIEFTVRTHVCVGRLERFFHQPFQPRDLYIHAIFSEAPKQRGVATATYILFSTLQVSLFARIRRRLVVYRGYVVLVPALIP